MAEEPVKAQCASVCDVRCAPAEMCHLWQPAALRQKTLRHRDTVWKPLVVLDRRLHGSHRYGHGNFIKLNTFNTKFLKSSFFPPLFLDFCWNLSLPGICPVVSFFFLFFSSNSRYDGSHTERNWIFTSFIFKYAVDFKIARLSLYFIFVWVTCRLALANQSVHFPDFWTQQVIFLHTPSLTGLVFSFLGPFSVNPRDGFDAVKIPVDQQFAKYNDQLRLTPTTISTVQSL